MGCIGVQVTPSLVCIATVTVSTFESRAEFTGRRVSAFIQSSPPTW
jgi:hypothetical protein